MAINILMPALSPDDGRRARWRKWLVRKATRSSPATSSPRSRPTRRRWSSRRSTRASLGKILVADGTAGREGQRRRSRCWWRTGEAVPAARRRAARSQPDAGRNRHARRAALEGVAASGGKVAGAAEQPVAAPQPRSRASPGPNGHGRWRSRLRLAAGAAHGAAGRARPAGVHRQRPGRPDREGGYRGGAGTRPGRRSSRRRAAPRPRPRRTGARSRRRPRRWSPRRIPRCRTAPSARCCTGTPVSRPNSSQVCFGLDPGLGARAVRTGRRRLVDPVPLLVAVDPDRRE